MPNRAVLKADSISWMTSANVPNFPPMLSRVPGVRYPGDDFMQAVFQLDAGQTGVAVDNPQTHAYAVMVVSVDSDEKQLRETFIRSGPTTDTFLLAQRDNQLRMQDWYQSLEKQLGVKWERPPHPDSRVR